MKRIRIFVLTAFAGLVACEKAPELNKTPLPDRIGLTAVVTKDGINLRKMPNASSPVVSVLPKGAVLTLIGKSADRVQIYKCAHYWFQASYKEQTGWVYGEFLTNFTDTNRKSYRTAEQDLKIEMLIPQSWTGDSSVLSDAAGEKIMETSPPDEFSGDFETAIRAKYKTLEKGEHPYKLNSLAKVPNPKFQVFRVISETEFEGGCPNWAGQWYPVGYYFRISGSQYLDIRFYLSDIKDSEKIHLFDEIVKTVDVR